MQHLLALTQPKRQKVLEDFLQGQAARVLGMEPSRLSLNQPLDTMGLDSLMAMELKNSIESKLRINLSVASLLQGPTISKLVLKRLKILMRPKHQMKSRLSFRRMHSNESPLSYGQQALWFLHQLSARRNIIQCSGSRSHLGDLDVPLLNELSSNWWNVTNRCVALSCAVNGEPVQRVHSSMDGVFPG